MKKIRLLFTVVCITVIAFVTGCQPIDGVDMNKVLYNPKDVSFEGKASLSLDINVTDQTISESSPIAGNKDEQAEMVNLFEKLKINLNAIKVQDSDTMSAEGSIVVSKGTIPFKLSSDKNQMVMQLVGAGEPIVFRSLGMGGPNRDTTGLNEEATQKLFDSMDSIQDLVVSYVVKQLPNPKTIGVQDESVTINETTLNLKRVRAELNGSELHGYLIGFLDNILNDKSGLESLIDQLIDLIVPIYAVQMEDSEATASEISAEIKSGKEQMVSEIMTMIQEARTELDNVVKDNPDAAKNFLGIDENSTMKVDLYVNETFDTLKSSVELVLAPPADNVEDKGQYIKLTIDEEKWNVGGDVKADIIDPGPDAIIVDENMRPRKMMRSMNAGSLAYDILRNDFHLTRQIVTFPPPSMDGGDVEEPQPLLVKGVAMVPLRKVADGFEADLNWSPKTKEIQVMDEGKKIVIPVNTKLIYVDGKKQFVGRTIFIKDGVSYVPARATFRNVGANINWFPDTKAIEIVRQ